jgi:serine protease Do
MAPATCLAQWGANNPYARRKFVTKIEFRPAGLFSRRDLVARIFGVLIIAAMLAPSGQAMAKMAPDSFADLAAKLLPAVVNISTTQVAKQPQAAPPGQNQGQRPRVAPGAPFEDFFREFFDRQRRGGTQRKTTSLGSGFVIDPSGLVVTNNHVIAEADEIMITFSDDRKLKATVVGRDAKTDLALLKVDPKKPLVSVSFGNSDGARVGDWVVAIGNPFGLGGTVTAGIISARHRDINSGPYDDFIQTDASINRGNSGGPMFNIKGEVVGVNSAIYSPSGGSVGIGFAIPSNLAKPVIAQLRKFGKAKRGWLGVNIQSVTKEIAEGLGLTEATGALVANITPNSPAAKGKVEIGDVILTFDGKKVGMMRRLPRIVAETDVGKRVMVDVWRKNEKVRLEVLLGEFPEAPQTAAAVEKEIPRSKPRAPVIIKHLGLALTTLTSDLREKYKLDEAVNGVVVVNVNEGGAAAEKSIRPGDIIRKIGPEHAPVTKPSQVKSHVEKARKNKMKSIIILLERGGSTRFVGLKLEES